MGSGQLLNILTHAGWRNHQRLACRFRCCAPFMSIELIHQAARWSCARSRVDDGQILRRGSRASHAHREALESQRFRAFTLSEGPVRFCSSFAKRRPSGLGRLFSTSRRSAKSVRAPRFDTVPGARDGGVPKRSNGADCKSAGIAFGGSNPPPTTCAALTNKKKKKSRAAGVAQLARASAFQAEGRGFESRLPLCGAGASWRALIAQW